MSLRGGGSIFLLVLFAFCAAAQESALRGRVCDPSGRPIAGATVTLRGSQSLTTTDDNGQFVLPSQADYPAEIVITATGWSSSQFQWQRGDAPKTWMLHPQRIEQRVTVTGDESTRSVLQFDRTELLTAPAVDLDTQLRQVPGFTLFRRTPSWSANPTTQGVSLRGAGASGTSRAVVTMNGIPLNDPFGGWIYWGRVSPDTVDQAVVTEGGASDLYGSQAMGGAVELIRNRSTAQHLTATSYIGNLFTPGGSLTGDAKEGKWWTGGAVSLFRTNGYVPVAESERGPVDTVTNSENASGWVQADRDLGEGNRAFVGGNLYGESRQNGTVLQFNSATIRELRAGVDWGRLAGGELSTRVYGGTENLRQTFSAVSLDRASETLTRDQSVPVNQWGVNALWSKTAWSRHSILIGMDTWSIEGDSEEWTYALGVRTGQVLSGGSQRRVAAFAEDRIRLSAKAMLSAGVRVDYWNNAGGRSRTLPIDPSVPATLTGYPDRSDLIASPRGGISYAPVSRVVLKASVSQAFRAPTLNELYRSFRVGNVLTLSNAGLNPERQTGAEAGASVSVTESQSVSATYFWSRIDDPVSNVTLAVTPTLITRQRQNLGSLRSTGVELSWTGRWTKLISTEAGYQCANAIVSSFPSDPGLVGLWIPQVARHHGTAQIRLEQPGNFAIVLGGRYQGVQFDDDRNQLPLGGYFVAETYVSKTIRKNIETFIGVENVLNRRYEVARTPVTSIGPPVLGRIGVRLRLGER